jgi:hypothetical protein
MLTYLLCAWSLCRGKAELFAGPREGHADAQLHMHTRTHAHTHAHTYTHAYTHTHTHAYTRMLTYLLCAWSLCRGRAEPFATHEGHADAQLHMHTRTHTHTHTHIHTHTHTHTHAYTRMLTYLLCAWLWCVGGAEPFAGPHEGHADE